MLPAVMDRAIGRARGWSSPALVLLALCGSTALSQTSTLVSVGAGGRLQYSPYANQGQSNAVNIVPDFSFAGYRGGGVPLPVVPVVRTITAPTGDARALIQAAIDETSGLPLDPNGFRGAILLKTGRYEVSRPLFIRASGVVLRGEGQNTPEKGGTEIVATSATQHDLIQLQGAELSSEPTAETVLDTRLYPEARTWQEFNVLRGVAEELEGDRVVSFHLTADVNQFVSYASREDSAANRPVLRLTLHSSVSGLDTVVLFSPLADTYVQGGTSALLNFGSDPSVAVKNAGVNANVTREGYLKFDISGARDSVKSAVLRLYAKKDLAGDPAALKTVYITASSLKTDAWDEMTLTYATRPTTSGSVGVRKVTATYVPTGATTLEIDNVAGLAVGDTIMVTRTPNETWITTLDMAQYGWVASEYRVSYERIVAAISGNTITLNIPLVQAIETVYGGGEVTRVSVTGRLRNCGIENLLISSAYASEDDESHGWTAVVFSQTLDCWMRKVTARYFGYSCVVLSWAHRSTIEECAMLDPKSITTGSRKYPFNIDKGSFNLFQRCYARGGRHDFVTGSRVAGPNAFVDCYSTQTYADIGPHHRYATGILFDNIQGGETRVQNRKDMGSGHGWAGAQTMFWNCQSNTGEFKVESPVGAMNWGIGCAGVVRNGAGFWESWGTRVTPRSLYYQQLQDRLGEASVKKVTLPEQRTGNSLWPALMAWAGMGDLSAATGVQGEDKEVPGEYALAQNSPNPFNGMSDIGFQVSESADVRIVVYDLLGREVAVVADGLYPVGRYSARFDASNLSSGVYLYRMDAAGEHQRFSDVKKMILTR